MGYVLLKSIASFTLLGYELFGLPRWKIDQFGRKKTKFCIVLTPLFLSTRIALEAPNVIPSFFVLQLGATDQRIRTSATTLQYLEIAAAPSAAHQTRICRLSTPNVNMSGVRLHDRR